MIDNETSAGRLVLAMLESVEETGWRAARLADVGARAGLSTSETHALCADRGQLLDLFARQVDAASVAGLGKLPDDPEARYDRLLDILMQRFEALQAHKAAVAELIRDVPREPDTVLRILPQSRRSFGFVAREAGFPDKGVRGQIFTTALATVWLATQRVWLRDESADLSETMAALDRNLRRATETLAPVMGRTLPATRQPIGGEADGH